MNPYSNCPQSERIEDEEVNVEICYVYISGWGKSIYREVNPPNTQVRLRPIQQKLRLV